MFRFLLSLNGKYLSTLGKGYGLTNAGIQKGGFEIVGEAHFSRRRRPPRKRLSLGGSGGMPPPRNVLQK